jgi:hypothetical protein
MKALCCSTDYLWADRIDFINTHERRGMRWIKVKVTAYLKVMEEKHPGFCHEQFLVSPTKLSRLVQSLSNPAESPLVHPHTLESRTLPVSLGPGL